MKRITGKSGRALLVAAMVAIFALVTVPAMAQPEYADGAETAQPQNFDEPTLQKFAEAAVQLGQIQNKFSEQLRDVQDPEQATAIQREMGEEMVQAVQAKGIEVETYNAIANQISADPEMRTDMEQRIQEIQGLN